MSGKTKVLVLGGCGFIGSHVVDALLGRGYTVTIFDKDKVDTANVAHVLSQVQLIQGDFSNRKNVEEMIGDHDHIVHLIGTTLPQTSTEHPAYDVESNVIPTLNLLDAAKRSRVKRLVFASSGGTIYGVPRRLPISEDHPTNPVSAYGISKLMIEKYLQLYAYHHAIDAVSLRVSNPYGERQSPLAAQGAVAVFVWKALNRESITIWGDGQIIRDFIYIGDVVDMFVQAIEQDNQETRVFNVGSGAGTSLNDLLQIIERVIGRKPTITYTKGRKVDIPANVLDVGRARQVYDWQPKVAMEDGIARVAAFMNRSR
ncbi:MAG: NAD-dependent epimerase/dehydratase family protein [Desulfomonile tiedjei]|uniref:UDP-glucose 4-epimerase n=1 Tax=Desulfomonile tiedjei TaxID=2358 RepID=A0A9D6Z2M2_9BACT|nr:NAD-dependent epimerase/dehydratase family protein [Desulfomonile tiedjei]